MAMNVGSKKGPRFRTVTCEPNRRNIWANSSPTTPAPKMIRC